MKKLYIILLLVVFSYCLSAQNTNFRNIYDTIWYENFDSTKWNTYSVGEGPDGWIFVDSTGFDYNWAWSLVGPRGAWTSPNDTIKEFLEPNNELLVYMQNINASVDNGFMMLESDYYNTGEDGQMSHNSPLIEIDNYFQIPYIDLSGYEGAYLSFNELSRVCCHPCSGGVEVMISSDYNDNNPESAHWIVFDNLVNYGGCHKCLNIELNLNNFAGQDSVIIRFHHSNLSHYYFLIDDILIYEPVANDLVLTNVFTNYGYIPDNETEKKYSEYYTKIPFSQVDNFKSFNADVSNMGYNDEEDVALEVSVLLNESIVYNKVSSKIDINSYENDYLNIASSYKPAQKGDYKIVYNIYSNQTDQLPNDNYDTLKFSITDTVYSLCFDPPYNRSMAIHNWVSGGDQGDVFANKFSMTNNFSPSSISVFIGQNIYDIEDIANGDYKLKANIYKEDTAGNIENEPILSSELITVQVSDTMSFLTFPFKMDSVIEFPAGNYYAGIAFYSDIAYSRIRLWISSEDRINQNATAYAKFYGEWFLIDNVPVINLNILDTEVKITETVNDELPIFIYPNPVNNILHVKSNSDMHIILYNTIGTKIYDKISTENKCQIDCSKYPEGIYFLNVGNTTQKIIIRHK